MRIPKMNFEEQGWTEFLVGLLLVSPIFVAIFAGRWVADTLSYQTALILAIAAFVLSWLIIGGVFILTDPRRQQLLSLILSDVTLSATMFGIVIVIAYREWVLMTIMIGATVVIFSVGAYLADRRHLPSIAKDPEDADAGEKDHA